MESCSEARVAKNDQSESEAKAAPKMAVYQ